MEIRANGTRFNEYRQWEVIKYAPYDYAKDGLLKHLMSSIIVNTNNTSLCTLLRFVENSLNFVMKYTDILKNFKNIHWKNR